MHTRVFFKAKNTCISCTALVDGLMADLDVFAKLTNVCAVKICKKNQDGHLRHDEFVKFGQDFLLLRTDDLGSFAGVLVEVHWCLKLQLFLGLLHCSQRQ